MKPPTDQGSSQNFAASAPFASGFAGADLYRENAFRLAELGIESTDREFKKRIDAVEATGKFGMAPPPGPGRLLPLIPPADAIRLREVQQRIGSDPELRLADEFFWFWPQTPGGARTDEALIALGKGDAAAATLLWIERESQPAERAVAAHNLAVLEHLTAIEAEANSQVTAHHSRPPRSNMWQEVFNRWKWVHESEATWGWVHARIRAAGDARVTTGTVRRLQDWLPRALLTVNVQLASRFVAQGRGTEAGWQIALLASAGFDPAVAVAVRADAAALMRDQVRTLCASAKAESAAHPERGRASAESLLQQSQVPLGSIDLLLDAGDPVRNAARDEVAEQVRHGLIGYTQKTEDWAGAQPLLETALKLTATAQSRERVEKDLNNVKEYAKETNWWHGPGYYELPAAVIAELERGYALAESGNHAEAVRIVAGMLSGRGGFVVPTTGRSAVERSLAYALNGKAVRANNVALEIYNEDPPILKKFKAKLRDREAIDRLSRIESQNMMASLNPYTRPTCMICERDINGSYYELKIGELPVTACASCRNRIVSEQDEQKAVFGRTVPTPLLENMLAVELNPSSPQLQKNHRVICERARELNVPVPSDCTRLRLELGLGDLKTAIAAAQSPDEPTQLAGRRWVVEAVQSDAGVLRQLTALMSSGSAKVREICLSILHDLGAKARAAVGDLLLCLLDDSANVRELAREALDKIEPQWRTHPDIASVIAELSRELALAVAGPLAANTLASIGRENLAAISVLVGALRGSQSVAKLNAAAACSKVGASRLREEWQEIILALASSLPGASVDLAKAIITALNSLMPPWFERQSVFGGNLLKELTDPLKASDAAERARVLAILRTIGTHSPTVAGVLAPFLKSADRSLVLAVLDCLGAIGVNARPTVRQVLPFVVSQDARLRSAAIKALEAIDPKWHTISEARDLVAPLVSRLTRRFLLWWDKPTVELLGKIAFSRLRWLKRARTAYHAAVAVSVMVGLVALRRYAVRPATLTVVVEGPATFEFLVNGNLVQPIGRAKSGEPKFLIESRQALGQAVLAKGYRLEERIVTMDAGANDIWRAELVPEQGDLEPTVTLDRQPAPPGFKATVTWKIDGKVMPLVGGRLVDIPVGSRILEASHPEYDSASGPVPVVDGEIVKPNVNLTPKAETLRLRLQNAPKPKDAEAWRVPEVELAMRWIGAGHFAMGSLTGTRNNELPVTAVRLSRGYWLGETEVTQAQWRAVMGSNPSRFKGDSRPVETVSWDEAIEFCHKLTARERTAGRLPANLVYTLPTEAQWEYACRAGTTGDYAGDIDSIGWYSRNSGSMVHPVATKQANAWGLHDMHGNVWEWCLDWYADKLPGDSVVDPSGPRAGFNRVTRGGSWNHDATRCRSAYRFWSWPGNRYLNLGFRLALSSVP